MKLSKKLKWTLGLASMAALTAIPMSVALVGCSKGEGEKLSIDNDFVENIKNPDATINDVDSQIYNQAKFVSENFLKKLNWELKDYSEIANSWLNKATQKQIEDLLFINFNRSNDNFYNWSEGGDYSSSKTIFEIKNVEYDTKTHIVNFELIVNYNSYFTQKFINQKLLEGKANMVAKYSIKNMELIAYEVPECQCPTITTDTKNIKVQSTYMNYRTNRRDNWNDILELLNYAKEKGLSYDGKIIDEEYYKILKEEWELYKNAYYNYDSNINKTVGFVWENADFNPKSYNSLNNGVFGYSETMGIEETLDKNNQIIFVKENLNIPIFAIAEYNDDKSNFSLIVE